MVTGAEEAKKRGLFQFSRNKDNSEEAATYRLRRDACMNQT